MLHHLAVGDGPEVEFVVPDAADRVACIGECPVGFLRDFHLDDILVARAFAPTADIVVAMSLESEFHHTFVLILLPEVICA